MKKYLSSDISCFVNAMLVVLILLASSCSSNWKYEYLKTKEPHSIDAIAGNAKTENKGNINITEEEENDREDMFADSTYQADNLDEKIETDAEGNIIGKHKDGIKLAEVRIIESKRVITPVDTSGRLLMSLTVEVPKDIMASDWQMRLHPEIIIRQNKVETFHIKTDELFVTGSEYRDKQIKAYEKYSSHLSKISKLNSKYDNDLNLNTVLDTNISNYVNKYQLEYLIMRNFPNDSSISNDKFSAVLGAKKAEVINYYYNKKANEKVSKLASTKKKNYEEWVYNPITLEKVQTDNIVLSDTLDKFDRIFSEVRDKILEDDTLKNLYYKYLDTVKKNKKVDYPALKSQYFREIDSANLAALVKQSEKKNPIKNQAKIDNNDQDKKEKVKKEKVKKEKTNKEDKKKEKKTSNAKSEGSKIKLPNLSVEKFKLDKFEVISGNDTSKIYMQYDYSTSLNAYEFPNIDMVYISITGDVYNDTTHIYNFSMDERLEYPVTSTANLADTTEIVLDSSMVLRKADHGANYSIEFAKNSAALNPNFGANNKVINDIKASLDALMKNTEFDLDSIIVSATASPEGAINVNQRFSGQRSDAVSNYFKSYVDSHRWKFKASEDSVRNHYREDIASAQSSYEEGILPKEDLDFLLDSFQRELAKVKPPTIDFKVNPIAENWDDLYTLVSLDSVMTDKEKNLFYDTYDKINNLDVRENTMKKHSYYNYMSKELYPQIRVVKFKFHMHRKGMEHDTSWNYFPSEKFKEGVRALRGFDFIKAENILKNYPSYNAAICFIVRKKPIQAVKLLEDPKLQIDFYHYKAIRDSLTLLYVSNDTLLQPFKENIMKQINIVKDSMDRAAKIEFLKAKAYVMRNKGEEDWKKALESYLFVRKVDQINGLYNLILTGDKDNRGAVFGSSEYFKYSTEMDEYLQPLPYVTMGNVKFSDIIEKSLQDFAFEIWKERKKFFTPEDLEFYNTLKQEYMYDYVTGEERTGDELEKYIMENW